MKRMKWFALLLIVFSPAVIRADMPPEPGYTRVSVNIVLEVKDDISDYRFFLRSGNSLKEIFVKKGERTSVGAIGGGALYSSGTLVAIPTASLKEFTKDKQAEQPELIKKAYFEGRLTGVVNLIEHGFTAEVRTGEADSIQDPVFSLERKDGSITATRIEGNGSSANSPGKTRVEPFGVSKDITPTGWITIIAGCLGTFALITFGVWMLKRSRGAN